jgi:hypothetical protein
MLLFIGTTNDKGSKFFLKIKAYSGNAVKKHELTIIPALRR